MAYKIGRRCELQISLGSVPTFTINPKLSVSFDIVRNTYSSTNIANITIYNLSEKYRQMLRFDPFDGVDATRRMVFKAGYGGNIPVIFSGVIKQAWSVRDGVDWKTILVGYDLGDSAVRSRTETSFPKGTPIKEVIRSLMESLAYDSDSKLPTGIIIGKIGDFKGTLAIDTPYSGYTVEILNTLTGNGFSIDNGKAYALHDNEAILGDMPVIDSSHGLLGTPIRNAALLTFDMIFEPRLNIFQIVKLVSVTSKNYQAQSKIVGLKHKGMISESVCGDAITTVEMQYSTSAFKIV